MKIIKRSGSEVTFDIQKIVNAITAANNDAAPHERLTEDQIALAAHSVEWLCGRAGHTVSVEEIQDMVENQIMALGRFEVARKYIIYRYIQTLKRTSNTTDDKILSLIECNNEEVKQENSNKNPTVNSVQRDYMAGEVSKDITMRLLLPAEVVAAHNEGIIHFHDSDYFAQHMHNCDLINLDDMLQNGTVISGTLIERPHSFSTACNIATQIIAQVASCQYGGQSISLTHLAPFVDVSRKKIRRQVYAEMEAIDAHPGDEKINQIVEKRLREEVARGEILVDYYLALEPSNPLGEIDGIETVEPAYGIPSRWILPENKEMAEIYGYNVIDPLSVMLTHLSETVKRYAYELLNRAETMRLVENLKRTSPELVEEVVPNVVSYATLEKVLRSLLKEGVPIRDLGIILETLADALGQNRDIDAATEQVRGALARTITRRFCEDGQLRVVTLDAEVERKIISSLTRSEQGVYLALGSDLMQQIITQVADYVRKFNELSQPPILLVSQVIRGYFSRMITQFYPNVYVLSFNEVTSSVQIQAIGNITQEAPVRKAVGT